MRLPESMTKIAPVGAVLTAEEAGEALLSEEVAARNARLCVASADAEGLSRWEREYGLADWTGVDETRRRARIRAAMAGGQTLTPERLRSLAVTVGGAETGEVTEDFADYAATLTAVCTGKFPTEGGLSALRTAVEQQKPAHLDVSVVPCAALQGERNEAHHGGLLRFAWAAVPACE